MDIEGYSIPENLLYTAEHDWIRIENDKKTIIGITDYAAKTLHDIVYVDLPGIDSKVEHLSPFGSIESVKAVSDLYSPITGIISNLNDDLKTILKLYHNPLMIKAGCLKWSPHRLKLSLNLFLHHSHMLI